MMRPLQGSSTSAWWSAMPPLWWGALLVGLVGIALVALRFLAKGLTITVLAIPALIVAILVLLRPQLGLYALVVCAGIVRVKAGTGTGSVIVASLGCAVILCLCWLAHHILHRQRLNYLPRQVVAPAFALMFFAGFSLLWGRATLDPRIDMPATFLRVQIAALLLFVISVGLLFVGADLLRDREARNWIMIAIVAIGFAALPFRALDIRMPIFSVFGLFGVWFVALCWSHALVNERLPRMLRWFLGFGAFGWLLVQMLTQLDWTSGWLPPCIALIIVTVAARPRLGVPLLLAMATLAFAFQGTLNRLMMSETEQGSLGGDFGRLELWARNIEVLKDYLLFGTGPAGYALYYVTLMPEKAMSTHNNYIDILAETGIFGLLSFLVLLLVLGWLGWRTLPTLIDGADRAACAAALGGLVAAIQAMALGDWVIPFVYNQTIAGFDHSVYTWLMLAILCGLWAQQRHPVSDYA
jgi:O-antigen ligase